MVLRAQARELRSRGVFFPNIASASATVSSRRASFAARVVELGLKGFVGALMAEGASPPLRLFHVVRSRASDGGRRLADRA